MPFEPPLAMSHGPRTHSHHNLVDQGCAPSVLLVHRCTNGANGTMQPDYSPLLWLAACISPSLMPAHPRLSLTHKYKHTCARAPSAAAHSIMHGTTYADPPASPSLCGIILTN